MNIYILALEGGGDLITKVVNEEAWNWIFGPSGRPPGESSWTDPFVPASQMTLIEKNHAEIDVQLKQYDFNVAPPLPRPIQVQITSGSWENDRALWAKTIPEYAEVDPYDEDAEEKIQAIATKRGDAIIETWEGYIY